MPAGTRLETKSLDRMLAIAASHPGIGFQITNKSLTGNVATLTAAGHNFAVADQVLVKGVDSVFDGTAQVVTAVNGNNFSFACAHADIASVAVPFVAGASKRCSQGYKRWDENLNFEQQARALTAEAQGYFWAGLMSKASQGELELATLQIAAELVVPVPKDLSTDLNAAWDLALNLQERLEASANYQPGENWPRLKTAIAGVDQVEGGGLVYFDFGLGGAGGSCEIIDP